MAQSRLGRLRGLAFRVAAPPVHWFLGQALRDEDTHAWLLHTMGNENAMNESGIAQFVPPELDRIAGFEDCYWLYSSNPLNHGVSRLRLDEASYLYSLVCSLHEPHVAEIGRYKGGTTFLLAAAGASVVSLDNGRIPGQRSLNESLNQTLEKFGLSDTCVTEIADALEYPVQPNRFDLVFLDIGLDDSETTGRVFERWWGTVKFGGSLIFRDGKKTVLTRAAQYVDSLADKELNGTFDYDLPGSLVMCTRDHEQ